MKLELIPAAGNSERIRQIWECLENAENTSYFLSWGWIENWINSLPPAALPDLAVFLEREEPLLAFFIGKTTLTRAMGDFHGSRHLFATRAWFLNATGTPDFDRVSIEYNGFLYKQHESLRLADILKHLPGPWEELYLPGLDMRSFPGTAALDAIPPFKTIVKDDTIVLSPFVDLNQVRAKHGDYLSLLSANTRAQIHRSYRLCEKTAPIETETAHDAQSAMEIYHELVVLHEESWGRRNQQGAFSSDYLRQFHMQLIQRRFEQGEIQLLRIKWGKHTIACLYNFVYKGNVFFYQSGIRYDLDKRLKPGLVAHAEAIKYNAIAGHRTYDFMAGESRYKMSLATHHNRLIWIRLQKPLIKFRIEDILRAGKNFLAGSRRAGGLSPKTVLISS